MLIFIAVENSEKVSAEIKKKQLDDFLEKAKPILKPCVEEVVQNTDWNTEEFINTKTKEILEKIFNAFYLLLKKQNNLLMKTVMSDMRINYFCSKNINFSERNNLGCKKKLLNTAQNQIVDEGGQAYFCIIEYNTTIQFMKTQRMVVGINLKPEKVKECRIDEKKAFGGWYYNKELKKVQCIKLVPFETVFKKPRDHSKRKETKKVVNLKPVILKVKPIRPKAKPIRLKDKNSKKETKVLTKAHSNPPTVDKGTKKLSSIENFIIISCVTIAIVVGAV